MRLKCKIGDDGMDMANKPDTNPAAETAENLEETTTSAVAEGTGEAAKPDRPLTRRYNRHGKRRGKYAYAAPLGMLISLLSIVGIVALVFSGISAIQKAADTTALKEEFYYFLEPVLAYNLEPFEGIAETEQDAFLSAAAYKVSLAEQVRMLVEADENCRYAVDDKGRISVPLVELEAAYTTLFGPNASLTHRSLTADNLEYSGADNCYYVPFQSLSTGYLPIVESVKHRGDTYTVRVGFVANNDVKMDEHGKQIDPTADMATYFQTYTLVEYEKGSYYIDGCKDE